MDDEVSPLSNCCAWTNSKIGIKENLSNAHDVFHNFHLLTVLFLAVSMTAVDLNLGHISDDENVSVRFKFTMILQGRPALVSFSLQSRTYSAE